jgi:hypothetical protein
VSPREVRGVVWLPATATVHADRVPGRVRLTIVDGDAAVALVLDDDQADQMCRELVDSRPWSSQWWVVYGR